MSKSKRLLSSLVPILALGVALGARPREDVPVAYAACSSLPAGGFVWNVNNVPFTYDYLGNPDDQMTWALATTFIGAQVRAKYETTEQNAVWYCAQITGLNAFTSCAGSVNTYPAFPAGVFAVAGVINDPSTTPCNAQDADGNCVAEIKYTLSFAKFDGAGIGARTLAQTYYWVDGTATPTAHDFGDCGGEQAYRYANSGPIYGNPCSGTPRNDCYTAFYEPAP